MRSPDDVHDEWLVLRCQSGDAEALAELVARWQPRLVRHAARLTGRKDAANDVVQVTWMAIIRGPLPVDRFKGQRRCVFAVPLPGTNPVGALIAGDAVSPAAETGRIV